MDFLLMQHSKPEYQCRFKWENNSMAFWDNRSCQHYASSDYMGSRRKGRRICIAGERPFFDSQVEDPPIITKSKI
jgi:Probable taurine catabolism dioxygenase